MQERLARRGARVRYDVTGESGPPHDRVFEVAASVNGELVGRGSGRSKKAAEQAAAEQALERPRLARSRAGITSEARARLSPAERREGRRAEGRTPQKMHLSSITIKGFKSFPERTKLVFSPGVSVIVGPNGCGKSNVTDAVLWALGEQSPLSVRGQTMQDMIYAGGDGIGPSRYAEVEVVLEADGDASVNPDTPGREAEEVAGFSPFRSAAGSSVGARAATGSTAPARGSLT